MPAKRSTKGPNGKTVKNSISPTNRAKILSPKEKEDILFSFVDNRLFGSMIPQPKDNEIFAEFQSIYVGPVQIMPSITPHEIVIEATQVTSPFKDKKLAEPKSDAPTDEESEEQLTKLSGGMGFRYTVPYALYVGTGIYNAMRGNKCRVQDNDLKLFDEAAKFGPVYGRSATKTWVQHILYLHVEYEDGSSGSWNDLARFVQTPFECQKEAPYSPADIELGITGLIEFLSNPDNKVKGVDFYISVYAVVQFPILQALKAELEKMKKIDYQGSSQRNSEYVWITEVRHSSANGDPALENQPRTFSNQHGYYTPERFKRWVRDYLEAKGENIFISREELVTSPVKASDHFTRKVNEAYPDEPGEDANSLLMRSERYGDPSDN